MRFSNRPPEQSKRGSRLRTVSDPLEPGLDVGDLLGLVRRALRLDVIALCTVDEGWVDVALSTGSRRVVSTLRVGRWQALSRMLKERGAHRLVGEDRSATATALSRVPARSNLAAIRVNERTVMIAGRRSRFTFQDLLGLQMSATAGELVGRNQRLLAELRRGANTSAPTVRALKVRNRQQKAIAEFGRIALLGVDEDELIEVAVHQVVYALRAEFVKMVEVLPGGTTAKVRAGIGWPGGFVGSEIPLTDIPQARLALGTNPSVLVRNIGIDRRFKPSLFLLKLGIKSGISAIINGKTAPFGELGVHSTRLRRFGRDDAVFMHSIANCLAEALMARRAEAELQASLHTLRRTAEGRRRLMHHLVDAVEEERKRIASDVHDDYLQVMAAVTLSLGVLARQIRDPARKKMIGTLAQTVEAASDRLRELIFELRADALQDGLANALRSYLAEAWRTGQMVWSVDDKKLIHDPQPDNRLVVYRICQEAISNARNHSSAKHMKITLASVDEGVLTTVSDDGVGFDPEAHQRPEPGHLGLVAMRERAELVGGWLRVKSAPSKGSNVDFWIPLEPSSVRSRSPSKKRPARRTGATPPRQRSSRPKSVAFTTASNLE